MKPMLAATVESVEDLRYPLLVSPKLDGIRAIVLDGVLVTRNLKPIPNTHVQGLFGWEYLDGLDGELIMGNPCDPKAFLNTSSGVRSRDGIPHVTFHVFDDFSSTYSFEGRLKAVKYRVNQDPEIQVVEHRRVNSPQELLQVETEWLAMGYEGVMLRDPQGAYKQGRSTLREQGLMKLKRFSDAEARIVSFEEQMHNSNEARKDALGRTERSSHKAGMKGKNTLGAIQVQGLNGEYAGVTFSIGSGFDDKLRKELWDNRDSLPGKVVKFKYFSIGCKDAPRFPTFLGFREDL